MFVYQATFGADNHAESDANVCVTEGRSKRFSGTNGLEPEIGLRDDEDGGELLSDEEFLAGAINNLDFEVNIERPRYYEPNVGTTVFRNLFEEY